MALLYQNLEHYFYGVLIFAVRQRIDTSGKSDRVSGESMTTEESRDELPLDDPAPRPKEKAKKQDYSARDMVIGVIAVAVAAVLLTIFIMPRFMRAATNAVPSTNPAANNQSSTAGRLLVSGRGTGDEVSDDFTVPRGCNRQTITYDAEQTDRDDGWVNFRVPYVDGRGGESLGPADVATAPTGSGLWTLTPGTYAIEIESWHTRWSYSLKCR